MVEKRGTRLKPIASGVISVNERWPLAKRLLHIHQDLSAALNEYQPAAVALEDMFFAKYANAAVKLGHARGVAMLAASQLDLIVHEYPPALVKRTVAGKGNATKDQVARLVGAVLGLKTLPSNDATDALAVAITHLQSTQLTAAVLRAR